MAKAQRVRDASDGNRSWSVVVGDVVGVSIGRSPEDDGRCEWGIEDEELAALNVDVNFANFSFVAALREAMESVACLRISSL